MKDMAGYQAMSKEMKRILKTIKQDENLQQGRLGEWANALKDAL